MKSVLLKWNRKAVNRLNEWKQISSQYESEITSIQTFGDDPIHSFYHLNGNVTSNFI